MKWIKRVEYLPWILLVSYLSSILSISQYIKVAQSAALGTKIIAIVNPNSGPDYDTNEVLTSYEVCIAYLKANNVEVIGYISTKVGWPGPISDYRNMADIKADIDKWYDDYEVDGIFIDEMTNRWPNADFESEIIAGEKYQEIVNYILTTKGYDHAVLNPGGPYFESAIGPFYGNEKVITVVYESPLIKYLPSGSNTCLDLLWTQAQGSFDPGVWCRYVSLPLSSLLSPLKNSLFC